MSDITELPCQYNTVVAEDRQIIASVVAEPNSDFAPLAEKTFWLCGLSETLEALV